MIATTTIGALFPSPAICLTVPYHQYSWIQMLFKLTPTTGQPLYVQLMQQIRHATETGALEDGDQLPGIRTLAEELVVSPNTVAKAYSELEHEGLLDLRQGAGAFVCVRRRARSRKENIYRARRRTGELISELREQGLRDDEIRRVFEAELLHSSETVGQR
jgi:GntR family transcriptional regulator